MFKTRLISGIILVIIALATIISGSWILFFTLLAVSLIGMRELYKVMKVSDEHVTVLELVGYLGAVLYYIAMRFDFGSYGTMAIIISMILILFVYVFGYPKYRAEQVMAAFFGMVYVAVMPKLESLPAWTNDAIHDMLVSFAEELGVKNATLMWPLRIAVAGKLVTPGGAVEICHILGREETIKRVKAGIAKLA